MVQICRRCQRVNPSGALYCHHDGMLLGQPVGGEIPAHGGAMDLGTRPFSNVFHFSSGEKCTNFQQLAELGQRTPAVVQEALRNGHLEAFLAAQGRGDLAGVARAAARSPNPQRGLDDFLGALPFRLAAARLRVEPTTLDLGTARLGEDRQVELVLHNDGTRLLYGSAVADADWLSVAENPDQPTRVFQFTRRAMLTVRLVGDRLRALDRPQETAIRLESSGGNCTVPVRLKVPVKPFAEGALAGALSPRELAKKARQVPQEAAALIENGAVARWYESNGWTYPVLGPTAHGIAAVQQLFEALGLVKPPEVELSESAIQSQGRPGEKLEHTLAVITQQNQAAIAFARSDQPWLQVGQAIYRGRCVFLPLTIAAVAGRPGETLRARLLVAANGGQQFDVPVTVTVGATTSPAAVKPPPGKPAVAGVQQSAVPVARGFAPPPAQPAAMPVMAASPVASPRRGWPGMVIAALLLVGIIAAAAARDYLLEPATRLPNLPPQQADNSPRLEIRYHDTARDDVLDKLYFPDHQATMRFGLVMLNQGQPIGAGLSVRRLTFDPWGRTNNACIRFDKKDERLFGSGGKGHWEQSAVRGWKDAQGQNHDGVKSIWVWDDRRIAITQRVELVRGEQSRLLDTCRVHYQLENRDNHPQTVGIRFLLDTFIGANDGVPFTIPGEPDLCDTMKDLPAQAKNKKIPDFLQALEMPDLANPGTIAHVRLKLDQFEPPARVTLGAWPNEKLGVLTKSVKGPLTLWAVPVVSLRSLGLNDSAVTIYWKEEPLKPGTTRDVGFEYGLWNLASQGDRLAAIVDGAFRPAGELTVVAYVNRAGNQAEESVTLKLPESFKLLDGAGTQVVPPLPAGAKSGNVPITWHVEAGPIGSYELTVTSSTGLTQTLKVEIRKSIY